MTAPTIRCTQCGLTLKHGVCALGHKQKVAKVPTPVLNGSRLARWTDPDSSKLSANLFYGQARYDCQFIANWLIMKFRQDPNQWMSGKEFDDIGLTAAEPFLHGQRRLRDLRQDGWPIVQRPIAGARNRTLEHKLEYLPAPPP